MKKMVLVVLVAFVALLSGCDEYGEYTIPHGNTAGNLNHRGLAAMCEDRIYFSNPQGEWRLYSMNHDGSDMVRLNGYAPIFINVVDGVIYYIGWCVPGVPGSIFRMNTDGSGHQLIFASSSTLAIRSVKVVGDQIFHVVYDSSDERTEGGSGLFVMQTDGTDRRRVTPRDNPVSNINVVGDYVFFKDGNDRTFDYMFRVNVDGTNEQPLNLRGNSMVVYGDRIYFLESVFGTIGVLYSSNLYGGDLQQLSKKSTRLMTMANGQVFLRKATGSNGLYKTNLDGSYVQILSDYFGYYEANVLAILGDEIFAFNTFSRRLFIMNLDGSNKRHVA